ncbi:MAG: ABC transporter ATP-binding protein [Candidatus Rokubacteria bacterium]|nr:ABC transporter ATP-binding protein [Candidatus Rokubacteria bacterium]
MSDPALALDRLSVHFGGLRAVASVSLAVREGEIFSIIGPNGAGKTTIFNAISGLYVPTSGEILLGGRRVTRLAPHARARLGISRTFQNIRLFRELTVRENVRVARYCRTRAGLVASLVRTPAMRRERTATDEVVDRLLARLGLAGRAEELAKTLPYGEQKRVEIARALAAEPRLLLLDEPAAGTSVGEAAELMALIRSLRDAGLTILLVEHHIRVVMQVSDRVAVLNHGELIAEGTPEAVRRDRAVIAAYLGEST